MLPKKPSDFPPAPARNTEGLGSTSVIPDTGPATSAAFSLSTGNSNDTPDALHSMFNHSSNPRFTRSALSSVGGDDNRHSHRYNNRNTYHTHTNTVSYNFGDISISNVTLSGNSNINFCFGPHEDGQVTSGSSRSHAAASTEVNIPTPMPMHRRGLRERRRGLERAGEVSYLENRVYGEVEEDESEEEEPAGYCIFS
ncbi:hypothetical protein VKT23_000425 [Stygiomarasmius scandens]|uniref:Uncharacterized protein n=1 Tax=Marasmiellus scandens TaxID=2682957 RepID=A0ABR1K417_9AGAR